MAKQKKHLVGVIHLDPLVGAPGAFGKSGARVLQEVGAKAIREAKKLKGAGFTQILIENFGDAPFYKDRVPSETIASLSVVTAAVVESVGIPVGINVLRNDGRAALGIAAALGLEMIRVNVLSGVSATDQGLVEGNAAELLRERDRLGGGVQILADVLVKHSRSLSSDGSRIDLDIQDLVNRSLADGMIVTGLATGESVEEKTLVQAFEVTRELGVPLYIGSGVDIDNVSEMVRFSDGMIVGSALRKEGKAGQDLDPMRIRKFVKAYQVAVSSLKKSTPRRLQNEDREAPRKRAAQKRALYKNSLGKNQPGKEPADRKGSFRKKGSARKNKEVIEARF